jgi:thiazole synthase
MTQRLFHCFGNGTDALVDTDLAVRMLNASGSAYLIINTHTVEHIASGYDLPVGYASATFGSVERALGARRLEPVLNINMPTTVAGAVERTRRAVALTGWRRIKLEVLTPDGLFSDPAAVVRAVELLRGDELEIWPLITPDESAHGELQDMGCPLVRLMGSAIGSGAGLSPAWMATTRRILEAKRSDAMLDGGVGSVEQAREAVRLGFDSVLVNSCLFGAGRNPAALLGGFREALAGAESPARP